MITAQNILETFYRALNSNTNTISNTITGRTFINLCWKHAIEILYWIMKTNWGCHTRDGDEPVGTYVIGPSIEHRTLDYLGSQEVA